MWVDFVIGASDHGGVRILTATPQDEEDQALPDAVSTDAFVTYICTQTKLTTHDLIAKGKVTVNMKLQDYERFVITPGRSSMEPAPVVPTESGAYLLTKFLEGQREQNRQQNELLRLLADMTEKCLSQPKFELVKPDVFDGESTDPQTWLSFYEYACHKNYWHSDDDKVNNLRLFLSGIAKIWYELRIPTHSNRPWTEWKDSFCSSFGGNKVLLWDRALSFKYTSGSALTYFYEKRRLLQLADSALPETSVVPLLILGLSPDLQQQVQVIAPTSVEDLLQGMRNLVLPESTLQRQPSDSIGRCPAAERAKDKCPRATGRSLPIPMSLVTQQDDDASSQPEESDGVFVTHHRTVEHLRHAAALTRQAITPVREGVHTTVLREGTETLTFHDGKFAVSERMVPQILRLYHDSPDSGGHDGFWRTYRKVLQRFHWKHMKDDVRRYVQSCHHCQANRVKRLQRTDKLTLPDHSTAPYEVVHADFVELKKRSTGAGEAQSFLVAVDQSTRFAAAFPGKEDVSSVIALFSQPMFENTKIIISDNGPAFVSRRLQEWAKERGIILRSASSYHLAGSGITERVIWDLKRFISMYRDIKGGWRRCLEAAVAHNNRSHNATIGCSPYFAAFGKTPVLPADQQLGIADRLQLREQRKAPEAYQRYRDNMKGCFDRRHNTRIPSVQLNDLVLLRKGLPGAKQVYLGPYRVVQPTEQKGVLKRVGYVNDDGVLEFATIGNVVLYHPRRDESSKRGSVGGHCEEDDELPQQREDEEEEFEIE